MNFSNSQHEYRKNGDVYTSVNAFLSRFEVPFAKGLIAEKSAAKQGREAEDLIAQWDLNAEISRNYGTAVHQAIEYWIRFGEITKIPQLKEVVERFANKYDREKLRAEVIVENDEYKIAGTIDQIEVIGKKRVNIIDVKTNAELEEKPRGYFLSPIDDIPHTKINKYRLQLSMYKYLLEQKGFIVEGIKLMHWNGKDFVSHALEPIDIIKLLKA